LEVKAVASQLGVSRVSFSKYGHGIDYLFCWFIVMAVMVLQLYENFMLLLWKSACDFFSPIM